MIGKLLNQDEQKAIVSKYAVESLFKANIITDGIKLGMGTGSTVEHVIKAVENLINNGKLKDIAVVPTSDGTLVRCEELGIPIYSLNSKRIAGHLDVSIDGADRVDSNKNLIKGGGAALLKEKIVAYNSDKFIVVLDSKKKVESLICDFPIPIEVIPFAYKAVLLALEKRRINAKLRQGSGKIGPTITDNGNYILDLTYPKDFHLEAKKEELELNNIVGVVENGFFTNTNAMQVFLAKEDGSVENY